MKDCLAKKRWPADFHTRPTVRLQYPSSCGLISDTPPALKSVLLCRQTLCKLHNASIYRSVALGSLGHEQGSSTEHHPCPDRDMLNDPDRTEDDNVQDENQGIRRQEAASSFSVEGEFLTFGLRLGLEIPIFPNLQVVILLYDWPTDPKRGRGTSVLCAERPFLFVFLTLVET